MSRHVPVTFERAGATVWVAPGTSVLAAARAAGVVIPAPCGARGVCGACGVRVVAGELAPVDREEKAGLSRAPAGVRLACRARVAGAVTVHPVMSQAGPASIDTVRCAETILLAVDLGTTTVAAIALDASSGKEIGRALAPNRQQSWGADVLTRMSAASTGSADELRHAAEDSVVEAMEAACAGCLDRVARLTIAGNTAMIALLAGADTTPLSVAPFSVPDDIGTLGASSVIHSVLPPQAEVILVPPIAGFVGGDALAGVIATGMLDSRGPALLVDVGTNAEIVLCWKGRLWVASAAAGPAFEGGGLRCGGPALDGAVARVRWSPGDELRLDTIGDTDPTWFSGAGLMSALSLLLRAGHLAPDGLLQASGPLAERFGVDVDGVVTVDLSTGGSPLILSQLDVRVLQLAKAAVRSGITHVLRAAGIKSRRLESLLVAGAFGGALPAGDLVALGVVPKHALDAVRHVGNSSLEGAAAISLNPSVLEETRAAVADCRRVELAGDPVFSETLMSAVELAEYSV